MAAGLETGQPSPIPDSAFRPVDVSSLPPTVADAQLVAPAPSIAPAPTPNLAPLGEPFPSTTPAARAQPSLGPARAVVVPVPTPTPKPAAKSGSSGSSGAGGGGGGGTSHSLTGPASYYCRAGSSPCTVNYPDGGGFDAYAAAGPKLRAAIGSDWRGHIVYVDGIRVKLIDWCQCYKGESTEKLLDLYYDVFARTGSHVTIRW